MKKRILTLAIALVLMLCASIPAMAATVTSETTQGATLTYVVAQSFTVTIPEAVTITNGTGTGTISVADSIIPFGEDLTVTITNATNYDNDNSKFRLKDSASDSYIIYTIANGGTVAKGTAFLTVAAGTAAGSAILTYTADAPTIAGTYTDSLTFTVAVG